MAATGTYSFNSQRNPRGFMTILSHVACEWFLMFLMFVDAVLSYTLTKFAQYCELQTPCLLCLRLDHLFGNEKPGCYLKLFCSNHRAEISSLVTCHIHSTLADVRDLCEECFMSTAMQTKSSSESYRFLVGKMGMDGFQSPYLNKNFVRGSLSTRPCSCCKKQWRVKSNTQRLIQLTPAGLGASKATVKPPLPRVSGRSRFSRRDSLKRMRDKFSGGPMTPRRSGNTGVDSLSHVGYTELKRTSDSESEMPFSDDDGSVGSSVVHQKSDSRESLDKILSEDLAHKKRSRHVSDDGPSFLDQDMQLDEDKPDGLKSDDLGKVNWEPLEAKPKSSTPPGLISLEDVSKSSFPSSPSSHMSNVFALSDLISPSTVPPQSNPLEVSVGVSANIITSTIPETTGAAIQHEVVPSVASNADITEPSNQDVTNEGREEKIANSDPPKLEEDLTLLPSTLSKQDIDSSNYRSPRAYHQQNGGDASTSDGIHKVASLEKMDSGYESLDGSSVCDIEGESILERLKRQVEYDKRCMTSLHKELEEERSAAAIAANQAMAMITRLQEEKAALHMEALQYLRMMEEQAEYDMEALEKANDLVAEKEKELQDLEAELEFYRNNFPDESEVGKLPPSENLNMVGKNSGNKKSFDANIPFIILENEKQYISESLKKLERKLQRVADIAASNDSSNGLYSVKITNGVENYEEELHSDRETELQEENNFQGRNDVSSSNGVTSPHDQSIASVEVSHVDIDQNKSTVNHIELDLCTLENEISDINERLEALENDRDFLEHACHTLQNGSEGLKFIQEIARQLQEFRKFDYQRRCLSDP